MEIYRNIDIEKTGKKMKQILKEAGYDVKIIQKYLHLSCPQPVYRWFNGKVLPTVDHLFMLSKLLGIHMEDFLVEEGAVEQPDFHSAQNRIFVYYKSIIKLKLHRNNCQDAECLIE